MLVILAPTYRWECSSLHARSVSALCGSLPAVYVPIHGNPVTQARTDLLFGALEATHLRRALWIDSDVWWHRDQDAEIISAISRNLDLPGPDPDVQVIVAGEPIPRQSATKHPPTLEAFATRQRDGNINRIPHRVSRGMSLEWTGFGMVLADLDWYRMHWPTPFEIPWFEFSWRRYVDKRKQESLVMVTEDAYHCMAVRAKGGTVVCAGPVVQHAHGHIDLDAARE